MTASPPRRRTRRADERPEIVLPLRRASGEAFREAVTAAATHRDTKEYRMLRMKPDGEGRWPTDALSPGRWSLYFVGGPEPIVPREIDVPERPGRPVELVLW